MMPDISTHPQAMKAFVNSIQGNKGVMVAVQRANGAGAAVTVPWLKANGYMPVTVRYEALLEQSLQEAAWWKSSQIEQFGIEFRCIKLIESRKDIFANYDPEAKAKEAEAEREALRAAEHQKRVQERAAELFMANANALQETFRLQAERDLSPLPAIVVPPAVFETVTKRTKRTA